MSAALRLLSTLVAVTLLAMIAGPAAASVSPEDGAVEVVTPRELVVVTEQDAAGPVTVTLTRGNGQEVQLTGDITKAGNRVTVYPPVLEPGTYVVSWSYDGPSGPRLGTSSFSVGSQSHVVTGTGERGPAQAMWVYALLVLVAAGAAAGHGLVAVKRRRLGYFAAALAVAAAVTAGFSSPSGPTRWMVLLSGPVALAAVGFSSWPGVVGAAALTGAGFGVLAVSGGGLAWLSLPLGALGGAAVATTIAYSTAVAVTPRKMSERLRRHWYVPATAMLLSPAFWIALIAAHREPDVSWPLLPLVGLALFILSTLPAGAAVVLGLRGQRVASRVLAGAVSIILTTAALTAVSGNEAVSVSPVDDAVAVTAPECASNPNRLEAERCLSALYTHKAKTTSINSALTDLKEQLSAFPPLRFYCHATAHAIGRASLAVNKTVDDAFADGFDVCDFGYYHGIAEAAAANMDDTEFRDAIPVLCRELASVNPQFYMTCNHGLGHAAARRANNDLVRGLQFCEAFRDETSGLDGKQLEQALFSCGTGVTMEWFATAGAVGGVAVGAVLPEVSNLREACEVVSDDWKAACVNYVGNTVDTGRPVESLMEIASWCTTQSPAEQECAEGVGRAAAGLGVDTGDTVRICASEPSTRDACLRYYIITLATTITYSADSVNQVCQALPPADRAGNGICVGLLDVVREVLASGDGKVME